MSIIWPCDKEIKGCVARRSRQKDRTRSECSIKDDMQEIFDAILKADRIVLATPICGWSHPASMKTALDRLICGTNKYYGDEEGLALWSGKSVAMTTTCGYRPGKGTDLFEESVKGCCKHSQLVYRGMLSEHDLGYRNILIDNNKRERAGAFARSLL